MQKHTIIYLEYFGFTGYEFIPCEIPGCGKMATEVHHIDARGRGGDPQGKKDVIENLQGICRAHHETFGDKKQYKEWLKSVHLKYMEDNKL